MSGLTSIPEVDVFLAAAEEKTNQFGNSVREVFLQADRYLFDFELNRNEWKELDNDQDAYYFGVWVNKNQLRILIYAEGDICLTQCDDAESFDREIAALCAFLGTKPAAIMYNHEGRTEFYQDRAVFFIDPARAAACLGEPAKADEGD